MKLELDRSANAAYVVFSRNPIVRTREIGPNRIVDYDADGEVVGIEFLNVDTGVDIHDLPRAEEIGELFRECRIRIFA